MDEASLKRLPKQKLIELAKKIIQDNEANKKSVHSLKMEKGFLEKQITINSEAIRNKDAQLATFSEAGVSLRKANDELKIQVFSQNKVNNILVEKIVALEKEINAKNS